VIKRIFPSTTDFENLSSLRTEVSPEANHFDYSKVVVRKPWGYEYLWYQNSSVAVWMLHLTAGSATSMHCHARKRTSLVVMSGAVECSTFNERHRLQEGHGVVLEPCVFHSTQAVSEGGAFVMEVETPPLKGDLLRYRDNFGRAGKCYEGQDQYVTDFREFYYRPLPIINHNGKPCDFLNVHIQLLQFQGQSDLEEGLISGGIVIPFLGRIAFGRNIIAEIGEAIPVSDLPMDACPPVFAPVELLQIWPGKHIARKSLV
jgi:hypothetical protein